MAVLTSTRYMLIVRLDALAASARLETLPGGEALLVCRRRLHRAREPLRIMVAADASSGGISDPVPRLSVTPRSGMWAAYDVRSGDIDGEVIGTIRRRGVGTPVRAVWELNTSVGETGEVRSTGLPLSPGAAARTYTLTVGGEPAAVFRRRYSPLHVRMELDFLSDPGERIDRRLSLAVAFLLAMGLGAQRR